jgi:hypothetical protein
MTRPRFLTAPRWKKAGCRDLVVRYQGGPTGTDVGHAQVRAAFERFQNKDDLQVTVTADVQGDTTKVANLRVD